VLIVAMGAQYAAQKVIGAGRKILSRGHTRHFTSITASPSALPACEQPAIER
jgi:hypothetical protein